MTILQLVNRFSTFYGTCRLITVFRGTYHWSLSWAKSNWSTPSHTPSI